MSTCCHLQAARAFRRHVAGYEHGISDLVAFWTEGIAKTMYFVLANPPKICTTYFKVIHQNDITIFSHYRGRQIDRVVAKCGDLPASVKLLLQRR